MKLKHIFPHLKSNSQLGALEVKGISDDSRFLNKGDLFFVIKRKRFDIFSVLRDIEPKVSVFVGDLSSGKKIKNLIQHKPIILVKDIQKEFFRVADLIYGFKKSGLKIIGVTGTNGKTTTAYLIYHILKEMGKSVSLISTVRYHIGTKTYKGYHTTPDFLTLRKIFKKIKKKNGHFVVMEVSSHAIVQKRIRGIDFLRCVFTNLSRDHLDYHKTIKNYFDVKKKLFLDNKKIFSVINTDDSYGRKIFKMLPHKLSYGIKRAADCRAYNINLDKRGSRFNLVIAGKSYPVTTDLCGRHNILNILAAVGVVFSLRFPLAKVVKSISHFRPVEGRFEPVTDDIFIDYAHTPDALRKVLLSLREVGYKKIICLFGCGGERDKGKRKTMGRIACRYADFSFITSDNPRNEDPLKICRQVKEGFKKRNYSLVVDRREAIKKAIELFYKNKIELHKDICLLVAGKGHEDYQIIGNQRIPFKDREVIREELIKYDNYRF